MKKIFFLMMVLGLLIGACGTSAKPGVPAKAAASPSPIANTDLSGTTTALVEQTIQAMPSATIAPSDTPVVLTETPTATFTPAASPTAQVTATETQNPILLTLTATLGTGTPGVAGTIIPPDNITPMVYVTTPTETEHPRTYGTMPPNLPSGKVYLINRSKKAATISLHCTTKEGYITFIEYPVSGTIKTKAPAGIYHFVAWIGGRMYTGDFNLSAGGTATVIMLKDHVETK